MPLRADTVVSIHSQGHPSCSEINVLLAVSSHMLVEPFSNQQLGRIINPISSVCVKQTGREREQSLCLSCNVTSEFHAAWVIRSTPHTPAFSLTSMCSFLPVLYSETGRSCSGELPSCCCIVCSSCHPAHSVAALPCQHARRGAKLILLDRPVMKLFSLV